ncbi:DUF4190 domain-containing protein [Microbacterium testaceum]|uniref:DUF4190 domain-containing protein n=1 Tax=Microbacterium testaceum TaxID=2033 RepID=UPI0012466CB9|nr:DUF4190 domain-containing protein [Microbacterium testaceum]
MSETTYPQAVPPATTTSIPGRTLGIIALVVAFPANLIGLILGIVALVKSRKAGVRNGPAVAAIIVGAVFLILSIVVMVVVVGGATAALGQCAELGPGTYEIAGQTITCN